MAIAKYPAQPDELAKLLVSLSEWLERLKDESCLTDRANRETLYHFLKKIRDWAAVTGRRDAYGVAHMLMKQFRRDDVQYSLLAGSFTMGRAMLERLYRLMNGTDIAERSEAEREVAATAVAAPVAVRENIGKLRILVLHDKKSHREREAFDALEASYAAVSIDDDDFEATIGRELMLEREPIVFVNRESSEDSLRIVTTLRSSVWCKTVPIVCVASPEDGESWAALTIEGADLLLPRPVDERMLAAAVRNIASRKQSASFENREAERRELLKSLQKEWMRYIRFDTHFSLVYVRLESFAHLIQTYGSNEVYQFYSELYTACQRTVRTYDEIKRWGMNSFILLLPMSRGGGAAMAAERIVTFVKKLPLADRYARYVRIGVMESEHGYNRAEDLILRVERQLDSASANSTVYQVPPLQGNSERRGDRIKLFIVDDDLVAPTILYNHLSPDEWEVDICTEGAEAIDRAAAFQPDLILSETSMSGMNGYAFCLQIRQILSSKQTGFIFLSKQTTSSNILRGLQVGADDYIGKPFSVAEVEAKLRRHAGLRMGKG